MFGVRKAWAKATGRGYHPAVFRRVLGVVLVGALAFSAVAVAGKGLPNLAAALKAFKRPHHAYDILPKLSTPFNGVATSRRVATAVDAKKHSYYVYVTEMQNKTACIVLIQGKSFSSHCKPETFMFQAGQETLSVTSGLIGGVAQDPVTKVVLTGGSKRLTVPLTTDNGFLYGCPAPANCAKWVRQVIGYNAAGKIVSRESVQ